MRIAHADVSRLQMRLREPYTIAYDSYDHAENLLLALTTDDGLRALGCAAPAVEVTGEDIAMAEQALRRGCAAITGRGIELAWLESEEARALFAGTPAARAAFDMALYDLDARAAGEPLWQRLGGTERAVATSVTIGICGVEETLARAAGLVAAGFGALKIKGGSDVEVDIARIRALRQQLQPTIDLRFDANQGYDTTETLCFARATVDCALSMIEQPIGVAYAAELPELRRRLGSECAAAGGAAPPLMADESALGPDDAQALIEAGAVDALNVKLMKCGGIGPALEISRIAEAAGVRLMVSCMDEAAVAIAAGLHLTLALPTLPWVDLDGHLDLIGDPTDGAVVLRGGRLGPASGAGLGAFQR